MSRYVRSAPAVYHDQEALDVCIEALRTIARTLPDTLALPSAERVVMDDHHETCARDDVDGVLFRLIRARALCTTEIARLDAAEVSA